MRYDQCEKFLNKRVYVVPESTEGILAQLKKNQVAIIITDDNKRVEAHIKHVYPKK